MNQVPHHMPQTTYQMMKQSLLFRLLFGGAITCVVLVLALTPASVLARCSKNRSCEWQYGSNYYECQKYSTTFCCNIYSSSQCGGTYCITKYQYWQPCWGVFITMWVASGVGFLLAVGVLVMWCNFRRRLRDPLFNNGGNYVQIGGRYEQPYVAYNNQPIYPQYQQQQPSSQPPINNSSYSNQVV